MKKRLIDILFEHLVTDDKFPKTEIQIKAAISDILWDAGNTEELEICVRQEDKVWKREDNTACR